MAAIQHLIEARSKLDDEAEIDAAIAELEQTAFELRKVWIWLAQEVDAGDVAVAVHRDAVDRALKHLEAE